MMVDRLTDSDDSTAHTTFEIKDDCYFLQQGVIAVTGIMEHVAQSASAMAVYKTYRSGEEDAPQGILAEIKHFVCHRRPSVGETLTTEIKKGIEVGGISVMFGKTRIGDEMIAEMEMKMFVP